MEQLAEEFLARYRQGERPAITEYTTRAPEQAAEIRELFPALILMEEAGGSESEPKLPRHPSVTVDGRPLERLGDYRVLREIGRGGMGVVYEARQESLGRNVALKVLPFQAGVDDIRLKRFRLEARAAAQLHHTNIVPVFDIGEVDGIQYFAMQFIQGHSLDQVLVELRRLRGVRLVHEQAGPEQAKVWDRTESLAHSMLSERWADVESLPQPAEPMATAPQGISSAASAEASVRSLSTELRTSSDFHFARSVARLGLQAAEALNYAHQHRVLHRDIKPANLLLDLQGTVWMTDFGLARTEGEAELTGTGDVVGTLRYLAPERFNGIADPRSDVYGLGLTLFELLALRPAFDESDRAQLIQRITQQGVPSLAKMCRRIPRDLETIVMKACDREMSRRYRTAEDMAEDLRRFLSDRPILAERTSYLEHVRRWTLRNPALATTISAVFGLLFFIVVAGTFLNFRLQDALNDAQKANVEKTEQLWQSLLERARAERISGKVGQRFSALAAIRKAAAIKITNELRDEAVAALALPDVEIADEWTFGSENTSVSFDGSMWKYVRMERNGQAFFCRRGEKGEEILHKLPYRGDGGFANPVLSPTGKFVAILHGRVHPDPSYSLLVWSLEGNVPRVVMDVKPGRFTGAVAYDSAERCLAAARYDGAIALFDLGTGEMKTALNFGKAVKSLAFSPEGTKLAACAGSLMRIFDLFQAIPPVQIQVPLRLSEATQLAWHPGGKRIAFAHDKSLSIWNADDGSEYLPAWDAHPQLEGGCVFAGNRLLSTDSTGIVRCWNADTGKQLVATPFALPLLFSSRDGVIFGPQFEGNRIRLFRLAKGNELQTLRSRNAKTEDFLFNPIENLRARLLGVSSRKGLHFFDLQSGEEIGSVACSEIDSSAMRSFHENHGWITGGQKGVFRWPIEKIDGAEPIWKIGPPRPVVGTTENAAINAFSSGLGVSADGKVLALPQGYFVSMYKLEPVELLFKASPLYDIRYCSVSPDGAWISACSHWQDPKTSAATIWSRESKSKVAELPLHDSSTSQFSPDGRWLVTFTMNTGTRVWQVPSWREQTRFVTGPAAISPNGRVLAIPAGAGQLRLVEIESGKEIVRLTSPHDDVIQPWCFADSGTKLIAQRAGNFAELLVWDLRLIRTELRELGMDWEMPEFPPPDGEKPIRLRIQPGVFAVESSRK